MRARLVPCRRASVQRACEPDRLSLSVRPIAPQCYRRAAAAAAAAACQLGWPSLSAATHARLGGYDMCFRAAQNKGNPRTNGVQRLMTGGWQFACRNRTIFANERPFFACSTNKLQHTACTIQQRKGCHQRPAHCTGRRESSAKGTSTCRQPTCSTQSEALFLVQQTRPLTQLSLFSRPVSAAVCCVSKPFICATAEFDASCRGSFSCHRRLFTKRVRAPRHE